MAKKGKDAESGLNQVWTVTVWVSDRKRAIEFYTQKLGFKVAVMDEKTGWVELGLPGGFTKIAIVEPTKELGESYYKYLTQRIGTATGISFETFDINALYEELKAKGVKFEEPPKKMAWGGLMTTFVDPDGNEFEVVEDRTQDSKKN
jgi:catechol 2,3-dioxygenase-like lactoylglutathione lyase family enzyme